MERSTCRQGWAMNLVCNTLLKAGGNEYQRIKEIAATKAPFILSLNYPQAQDVEDPNDARFVSLGDLKHWEMAPTNPAAFEKAGIPFCLTTADLRDATTILHQSSYSHQLWAYRNSSNECA